MHAFADQIASLSLFRSRAALRSGWESWGKDTWSARQWQKLCFCWPGIDFCCVFSIDHIVSSSASDIFAWHPRIGVWDVTSLFGSRALASQRPVNRHQAFCKAQVPISWDRSRLGDSVAFERKDFHITFEPFARKFLAFGTPCAQRPLKPLDL
jgi:hypothetical protein